MSYDNNLEVILSKVVSDNPNAPALRVNLEIDGVKYKAGLWVWERKDGSPVTDKDGNRKYKGKLEVDTYGQEPEPQRQEYKVGGNQLAGRTPRGGVDPNGFHEDDITDGGTFYDDVDGSIPF